MPMVYVSCTIHASLQDLNVTGFYYGGVHEVLDAFQLLKEKQILQFQMKVVCYPAVVFPLGVSVKKGKILSPGCIRGP